MSVWRGEARRGGPERRERMCGSWGGAWERPPLDPWPQNPASLYPGHFGSFFSPLRLSLLICTLGINEAATEGSYLGWGGGLYGTRWAPASFVFVSHFPTKSWLLAGAGGGVRAPVQVLCTFVHLGPKRLFRALASPWVPIWLSNKLCCRGQLP